MHIKGECYTPEVYGVKRGAMENVVTISGWRPQVCETPVYEIKDTDQWEQKRVLGDQPDYTRNEQKELL